MLACDDPATSGEAFVLTLHACRHCGGRVLRTGNLFRCSCCASSTAGSPDGICGCGMLASWGTRPPRAAEPKNATKPQTVTRWKGTRPFRCAPNPQRSAKSPSEVVILFGDDGGDAQRRVA